jgi:hypothetical protein
LQLNTNSNIVRPNAIGTESRRGGKEKKEKENNRK